MKNLWIALGVAGLAACLLSGRANAGTETYGTTGVSLSAVWAPFVSGQAGGDSMFWIGGDAPKYSDLFSKQPGENWGARIGFYYDMTPYWRFTWGVAYSQWKGKPVEAYVRVFVDEDGNFISGEKGKIHFDDLTIWSGDLGTTCRFFANSPVRPYLAAKIGVARIGHVGSWYVLDGDKYAGQYWRSSWTYEAAAGLGLEFAMTNQLAVFLDVKVQLTGKPMSELDRFSDADPSVALPVSLGVNYTF